MDSSCVDGSGRKFFICDSMGYGGKGICQHLGIQMYYFHLQKMTAHADPCPQPCSLHVGHVRP